MIYCALAVVPRRTAGSEWGPMEKGKTIQQLISEVGKAAGDDQLQLTRFACYSIGA